MTPLGNLFSNSKIRQKFKWSELYLCLVYGSINKKCVKYGFRFKELFHSQSKNIFDTGMQSYDMRQNEKKAYDIAFKEEMDKIQKDGNAYVIYQ